MKTEQAKVLATALEPLLGTPAITELLVAAMGHEEQLDKAGRWTLMNAMILGVERLRLDQSMAEMPPIQEIPVVEVPMDQGVPRIEGLEVPHVPFVPLGFM